MRQMQPVLWTKGVLLTHDNLLANIGRVAGAKKQQNLREYAEKVQLSIAQQHP